MPSHRGQRLKNRGIHNLIDPFSIKEGSKRDLVYVQNIGFLLYHYKYPEGASALVTACRDAQAPASKYYCN